MIMDITGIAVSFPMPELGDTFVCLGSSRKTIRSMVVSVEGGDQDWVAVLWTNHGHETINGARDRKDVRAWHPPDWPWDAECSTFKRPGTTWNQKARCFMRKGDKLPDSVDLPSPMLGEARGEWRARAKQRHPVLLDHVDAEPVLEAGWSEFEARIASARAEAAAKDTGRELVNEG